MRRTCQGKASARRGSVAPVTIGVTGATGGVGSRVVRHLLARPDAPPVVAIARRPESVPEAARPDARKAHYDDPASLRAAFAGIDTLVFVSSDGVDQVMRRHHEHVVDAAIHAGVRRVVYSSILDVSLDSSFYYSPIHRETEARLSSSVATCFARTSIFDEFFLETWIAPALVTGTLALPAGEGGMSLITREDTASALADAAASNLEGVLELTGPAAIAADEVARIAQAEAGRTLRYEDLDDDTYRRRLGEEGEPGWLIEAYASMFTSVREGRYAKVSTDVAELTGRPPDRFEAFVRSAAFA
jgi:NAD(P)H dehydrogenase (quinone)